MAVVLDDDIRMFLLDGSDDHAEHMRTPDTRHIFETYLLCPTLDELFRQVDVVLRGVYL